MIDKIEISALKDYLQTNDESEPRIARSFLEDVVLMFEEIQQYRAIGTVEECREARNKQIPKKPEYKDVYPHGSNHLCVCGFIVRYRRDKNCPNCGQLLDWSDTD